MPTAVLPEASYGVYVTLAGSEYVTDSLHTGIVTVTRADLGASIVSGTFELQLYQKATGKSVKITNGRFDYKSH